MIHFGGVLKFISFKANFTKGIPVDFRWPYPILPFSTVIQPPVIIPGPPFAFVFIDYFGFYLLMATRGRWAFKTFDFHGLTDWDSNSFSSRQISLPFLKLNY